MVRPTERERVAEASVPGPGVLRVPGGPFKNLSWCEKK